MTNYRSIVLIALILSCVAICPACGTSSEVAQSVPEPNTATPGTDAPARSSANVQSWLERDGGWELPPLASFRKTATKEYGSRQAPGIVQTEYVALSEVLQSAPRQPTVGVGTNTSTWLIRSLKEYSAGGRPFCYVMRGTLVEVGQGNKITGRLAASMILTYVDQDGDGLFESFRYSNSEAPFIPDRLMKR